MRSLYIRLLYLDHLSYDFVLGLCPFINSEAILLNIWAHKGNILKEQPPWLGPKTADEDSDFIIMQNKVIMSKTRFLQLKDGVQFIQYMV